MSESEAEAELIVDFLDRLAEDERKTADFLDAQAHTETSRTIRAISRAYKKAADKIRRGEHTP